MSDTEPPVVEVGEPAPPPPPPSVEGNAFAVLALRVDVVDGKHSFSLMRLPAHLPMRIYDRRTAIRYGTVEAEKLTVVADTVVAVVSPVGRVIAVLVGGSGKPARPTIAMAVKRALPGLVRGVVGRRRSSRPLGRSVTRAAGRKRRTSRR
jgi:hypothetical protein